MSNEMVEIKKQVAESSSPKKPFHSFKINPSSTYQPQNTISNDESDPKIEEDSLTKEEAKTEEEVELNGMWDFIIPTEEEAQRMLVTTRSKNSLAMSTKIQKQKTTTPIKEKIVSRKSKTIQTNSILLDPPTTSKTLMISDTIQYNIVEDIKKTRENISLHELIKLKQQQKSLLGELKAVPVAPLPSIMVTQASYDMGKPTSS